MKRKFFFFIFLLLVIIFIIINPYYSFLTKTLKISPLKTLFFHDLLKTYDDQVTVLLLGIAGKNHDGGTLSDSIIAANFNLKTHQLTTITIPRDIWSDTLQDKINTAYAYGEAKQKGGGLKLAKAEIEAVIGIPLQYALVIDFEKFSELINLLSGIDIDIENDFTDEQFPIPGEENNECGGDPDLKCRYQTISFKKGAIHLDGNTALKYVRSRHAKGAEGSDFARNKRQQKVLNAIKNKLMETLLKSDINKWKIIYSSLDNLITRDLSNQQAAIILKKMLLLKNLYQKEISLSHDLFLVPELNSHNGQYTLIPKENDFSSIHKFVQTQLSR